MKAKRKKVGARVIAAENLYVRSDQEPLPDVPHFILPADPESLMAMREQVAKAYAKSAGYPVDWRYALPHMNAVLRALNLVPAGKGKGKK